MDGKVLPPLFDDLSEADLAPRFRAVGAGERRHGIRLEQVYWDVLKMLAEEEGTTIGKIVEAAQQRFPDATNTTSLLRVAAVSRLQRELERSRGAIDRNLVGNLVLASPAPAIALASDKRLVAYNPPFLAFVQNRLLLGPSTVLPRNLRLLLDVQARELVRTLTANGNRPVKTGIVLGTDDRRVRGMLTVLIAPSLKEAVLIGYVSGG